MPDHIRALRIKHGLRQRDIAAQLGISAHQMRKWERGLAAPPSSAIAELAVLFGISPIDLERAQRSLIESVEPGEGYTTAKARYSQIKSPSVQLPDGRLRVADLFCGAGGISFGLELTGHFTTVAGIDLLQDRIDTFCQNHPHATGFVADIRLFSANRLRESLPDIDVLVGGPPCQGFSSIRPFRTLTEGDKRNTLIEHFLMAVSAIKPRWFIFENVLGILTHKSGQVLQSLLNGFQSCGYKVTWRVLNAALFGVPQNRERVVVVGNRTATQFSWPDPSHQSHYKSMGGVRPEILRSDPLFSHHLPNAITVAEALGDLPPLESGETSHYYNGSPESDYQEWVRDGSTMLTLHNATRHSKRMMEIIQYAGPNIDSIPKHLLTSGFSSCYSRLDSHKPSTTLTVNFVHPASNRCIHPVQNRALTPREGARLQSFPDSFEFCGTRAQIVKQIGNAVPPLLAKALGESILESEARIRPTCDRNRPSNHAT